MNKVFLLAFLLVTASAKLAIEINSYPFSRQMFTCLAGQNVSRAIFQIWDESGTISKDFLSDYI